MSIPLVESEHVPRGSLIGMEGGAVWVHPFDVPTIQHPRDPIAQLDALAVIIGRRAERRAERAIARIERLYRD